MAAEEVLAALADATRLRLLHALAARGTATATMLATAVPVSRQAVVKHLAVLDAAGLVSRTRVGRETRYTLVPEQLDATARWLAGLAQDWDRRLKAIQRAAEAQESGASAQD